MDIQPFLAVLFNQAFPVILCAVAVYVIWHAYTKQVSEHISDLRAANTELQEALKLFRSGDGYKVSGLSLPVSPSLVPPNGARSMYEETAPEGDDRG